MHFDHLMVINHCQCSYYASQVWHHVFPLLYWQPSYWLKIWEPAINICLICKNRAAYMSNFLLAIWFFFFFSVKQTFLKIVKFIQNVQWRVYFQGKKKWLKASFSFFLWCLFFLFVSLTKCKWLYWLPSLSFLSQIACCLPRLAYNWWCLEGTMTKTLWGQWSKRK